MITRKIAPAFAAGCSVVIKPPSETPYLCAALTKLALQAGIPGKLMQVLPTKDRVAATELCTNPVVKKISFTGSTGVEKMLAKLATGTLKKCSLELGGNAPFIVFDDADLELAAEGAMFCKFRCTGQTCVWYLPFFSFFPPRWPSIQCLSNYTVIKATVDFDVSQLQIDIGKFLAL